MQPLDDIRWRWKRLSCGQRRSLRSGLSPAKMSSTASFGIAGTLDSFTKYPLELCCGLGGTTEFRRTGNCKLGLNRGAVFRIKGLRRRMRLVACVTLRRSFGSAGVGNS